MIPVKSRAGHEYKEVTSLETTFEAHYYQQVQSGISFPISQQAIVSGGAGCIGGVSKASYRAASQAQCRGQARGKQRHSSLKVGDAAQTQITCDHLTHHCFGQFHLTRKLNNGPGCYKEKALDSSRQQLITVIWYQFINLRCTLSKLFFLFPFHW